VVENGIVPEYYADRIEPYVSWNIKTNYLYKNDLMLLDFLASNNWERPLYFANPSSVEHVFDVDRYCHLNGFVYKFMPVKAENYISGLGGLDPEASYDIMINKCKWGNLNEPNVTIDRESFRNSAIPKQNFMRLSQALLNENKMDSVVAVCDECVRVFPNEKITYDMYMVPFAEAYYYSGEIEKGNEVLEKIFRNYEQDVIYYSSLEGNFKEYYREDQRQAFMVLQRLSEIAIENEQAELAEAIDEVVDYQIQFMN